MDVEVKISNNKFYVPLEKGKEAKINYSRPSEKLIELIHTEVPEENRGQGLAEELAKFALNYAREKDLKVIPSCRFVNAYIKRHQEYQDLVWKN
jgi:uncharacterized protein